MWGNDSNAAEQFTGDPFNLLSEDSLIEGFTDADLNGTGNLDGTDVANDPLFIAPLAIATVPSSAGDFRLSVGSPAIDAGLSASSAQQFDLAGFSRFSDGNGDGRATIDLGAYEFLPSSAFGILSIGYRDLAPGSETVEVILTTRGPAGVSYRVQYAEAPVVEAAFNFIDLPMSRAFGLGSQEIILPF